MSGLEHNKRFPSEGKFLSTIGRFLLPFVKVPTNIVGETATYAGGTAIGSVKLISSALHGGIENMKPEEADAVMRAFKKGSIGAGMLLVGFFNPQAIGGYYQDGEKRRKEEVKAGGMKLFGKQIPSYLIHNPVFETMQLGATIRRVSDQYVRKANGEKGIPAGVMAGLMGLGEEIPMLKEAGDLAQASKDPNYYFGELAKNTTEPALLQTIARWKDEGDVNGVQDWLHKEAIKRAPETMVEHLKTGIPYLREQVAERKPKRGSYTYKDYEQNK
jgi:hypothetical protein